MMKDLLNPTSTSSWKKLEEHFKEIRSLSLKDLFHKDPKRFEKFSLKVGPILFDFSKNFITEKTLSFLCQLAEEMKLREKIFNMYRGEKINITEQRSVLHIALRKKDKEPILVNGKDIMKDVICALDKIKNFAEKIRKGEWRGFSGKRIKYVVNLGIGGSCLGPKMVIHALKHLSSNEIKTFFLSNIDPVHVCSVLKEIEPEYALFIISSKSFTTKETLENALYIKKWFLSSINTNDPKVISKHFVAITSNIEKAKEFGIDEENIFPMWEWVGGRFSLWSSIGLPIAIALGAKRFEELLQGASLVDKHFFSAPFDKNIPVIMALLSIWYNNFFNSCVQMIIPYSESLRYLPEYLQQLEMESNGKSTTLDERFVNYKTGYIVVGGVGTDVQHSFFQLLHQGTHFIPCDFIIFSKSPFDLKRHHKLLIANCLAQSKALMEGKEEKEKIYKHISGNKPSNTLLIEDLSPFSIGSLIALYEHKIFVEGVIWNINSFDQWGVELGKRLADKIYNSFENPMSNLDSSTTGLIKEIKKINTSL